MTVAIERNAALKNPDETLVPPATAALTEMLQDSDPIVRLQAASASGGSG